MSLIEEQLRIEQESIDFGIDHYRKQVVEAKQMSREGTTWYPAYEA